MIPKRDYEIVYQETNDEGKFVVIQFLFYVTPLVQFPENLFVMLTYPVRQSICAGIKFNQPSEKYEDVYPIYKSYGDNVTRIAISMIDQIKKDKKYSSRL